MITAKRFNDGNPSSRKMYAGTGADRILAYLVSVEVVVEQPEVLVVPPVRVLGPRTLDARGDGVDAAAGAAVAGPREEGLIVGVRTSAERARTVRPTVQWEAGN